MIEPEDEIARLKHKKPYSNFEIKAPTAIKEEFEKYIICDWSHPYMNFFWCRYPYADIPKKAYFEIRENFEREISDLEITSNPDFVYLAITSELNPGIKPSNRYKFVGVFTKSKNVINYFWFHPFFRNKGIIQRTLIQYGCHESVLMFQPPISKQMQYCLEKVYDRVNKDENLLKLFNLTARKYLTSVGLENEYEYSDASIQKVLKSIESLDIMIAMKKINISNEQKRKILTFQAQMILKIQNDKDFESEIIEWTKGHDFTDYQNTINEFMKTGGF